MPDDIFPISLGIILANEVLPYAEADLPPIQADRRLTDPVKIANDMELKRQNRVAKLRTTPFFGNVESLYVYDNAGNTAYVARRGAVDIAREFTVWLYDQLAASGRDPEVLPNGAGQQLIFLMGGFFRFKVLCAQAATQGHSPPGGWFRFGKFEAKPVIDPFEDFLSSDDQEVVTLTRMLQLLNLEYPTHVIDEHGDPDPQMPALIAWNLYSRMPHLCPIATS